MIVRVELSMLSGYTVCSGFVSTAHDVLEMSVVRGVRGVGGVYEMCICFTPCGIGCVGVNG